MNSLDRLDQFLSSDDSSEDCMFLSDLDGFLTGVICSPEIVPDDEWLEKALGGTAGVPEWVKVAIADHHAQILVRLTSIDPVVEPVFWQAKEGHVVAMDSCEGFMQAIALRPKKWLRLTESGTSGQLITPIMMHMLDENGYSVLGIPEEKLDAALDETAEHIPESVIGIYQYWINDRRS